MCVSEAEGDGQNLCFSGSVSPPSVHSDTALCLLSDAVSLKDLFTETLSCHSKKSRGVKKNINERTDPLMCQ